MKICIVQGAFLPVPPLMGGAVEKVWFGLGREFARRGHEVVHVSRQYDQLPTHERREGVEHFRVRGYGSPQGVARRLWLDLLYSRAAIAAIPPSDVIVTNSFWLPVLLRRRPDKGRVYVHVARFPKGQLRMYAKAHRLQTVSSSVANAMKRQVPFLARKIAVIPNPLTDSDGVTALRYALNPRKMVYIGRVHPEKGLDFLLNACLGLTHDYQLRVIGPWQTELGGGGENYWRKLQDLASKSQGKIELVGPQFDGVCLRREMDSAGVFVYPSLAATGETFGLAPLEAMARGCIPVVSDLECFRDFVHPGLNGFVFQRHGGEKALRERLCDVFNHSNLLGLSAQAQSTAQQFRLGNVAELYLSDFNAVLCEQL